MDARGVWQTGLTMGRRASQTWEFPPGVVGYAVGDIHGCADLLGIMLDRIEDDIDTLTGLHPVIVFLGDYVDRGPESKGVIDHLINWRDAGVETHFLRGNHEQAMRAFMDDGGAHRGWIAHGGAQTMVSYGVDPPSLGASEAVLGAQAHALRQAVSREHHRFFDALKRYVVVGDYAFVHAGVDARTPIELQDDADLYWKREGFLNSSAPFSHCIVHGHTPTKVCYRDHRRICVDTGAYATGVLSAARFIGDSVEFLDVRRTAPSRRHGEFA